MSDKNIHPEIAKAIKACGTQCKLAEQTGFAQQTISKLLNRQIAVSAEIAVAIDKATGGKVPRVKLRPDLFG